MIKLLVYGSINIDLNFSLDHIAKKGETISSKELKVSAGGKGANQASGLSKALGERDRVYLAAKTGEEAKWILDKLNSYGVNTDYVYYSKKGSGRAIIQLDKNGDNSIILYGGGNLDIERREIDEVFSHFNEGDWLIINAEINNLDLVFSKAKERNMKIAINPSPITKEILSLPLEAADLIILNEIEGGEITKGGKGEKEILKLLESRFKSSLIVLTLGENGAWASYNNKRYYQEAFKVKAIDTVGAGDTFLGYFISSIVLGYSIKDALRRASFSSSLAIQKRGAMDSIPTKEEFDKEYR